MAISLKEHQSKAGDSEGAFMILMDRGQFNVTYEEEPVRRGIKNNLRREEALALAKLVAVFIRDLEADCGLPFAASDEAEQSPPVKPGWQRNKDQR